MKILVIDDTQTNLDAAKQTLADHELTLVATYDEAYKILAEPCAESEDVEAEVRRRGFTRDYPYGGEADEVRKAHWEAHWRITEELRPPPPFDVVLCDLLMPAGSPAMGQKGKSYIGQEMPVGFALALMAVLQGARHVAVVTDTNHHDHPASAMLDRLSYERWSEDPQECPAKFEINGARVGYFHSPMIPIEGTTCAECAGVGKHSEISCEFCGGSGKSQYADQDYRCGCCQGSGRCENVRCYACDSSGKILGKDWGKVLPRILDQR